MLAGSGLRDVTRESVFPAYRRSLR
jgi:hypothetical protein